MTGRSQAATIRAALSTISLMERSPTSGRPRSAAAVPNPVMYTAGNPASSTSRAPSPSNTPGARTGSGPASSSRSRPAPFEPAPRNRPIPYLLSRTETEMLRPAIITACGSARSSGLLGEGGRAVARGDLPDDALGVGEVAAGPAPLAPLGRLDG